MLTTSASHHQDFRESRLKPIGKAIAQWHDICMKRLNLKPTVMGFADLSIAEIAEDYHLSVEEVFHWCNLLGITYRDAQTRLALEDAKAIILKVLAQREQSGESQEP